MTDDFPEEKNESVPETGRAPSLLKRLSTVQFAFLTLGLIFILYQLVGGLASFFIIGGSITEENVDAARWITLVGQVLFLLVPTLLLARMRHKGEENFFRLRLPDHRQVIASVIGVFALQQVLQGYLMLQDAVPLPENLQQIVNRLKEVIDQTYALLVASHSIPEFLFVTVVVALVPAVSEELLFRGLVQRNFERSAGGMRAAIAAGVIFGAYHLNPFTFVALAALGAYFGYLVYRSENISVAISAHFFNNFLACAAAYMNLKDDFVVMSPSSQPSPFLVAANSVLFLVVFAVSVTYFIKVTGSEEESFL